MLKLFTFNQDKTGTYIYGMIELLSQNKFNFEKFICLNNVFYKNRHSD